MKSLILIISLLGLVGCEPTPKEVYHSKIVHVKVGVKESKSIRGLTYTHFTYTTEIGVRINPTPFIELPRSCNTKFNNRRLLIADTVPVVHTLYKDWESAYILSEETKKQILLNYCWE